MPYGQQQQQQQQPQQQPQQVVAHWLATTRCDISRLHRVTVAFSSPRSTRYCVIR